MKRIELTDKNANEIYLDYMHRIERMTKGLPEEDRQDIQMELNSHIWEYLQQHRDVQEIENILSVLKRLGAPEETLKPLVAEKRLAQATRTFNPLHVVKAISLNLANGVSYIIFGILYLLLACFFFLIFAKIFYPNQVGLFFDNDGFRAFGMVPDIYKNPLVHEVLGGWFIPAVILISIVTYLIITLLLKLKYKLNK